MVEWFGWCSAAEYKVETFLPLHWCQEPGTGVRQLSSFPWDRPSHFRHVNLCEIFFGISGTFYIPNFISKLQIFLKANYEFLVGFCYIYAYVTVIMFFSQ